MASTQSINTTSTPPPPPPPPAAPRPRFRLAFRVLNDGLETRCAQSLNEAGLHAHGGAFHLFPQLPPELRLKIWECLIAPRVVAMACLDDDDEAPWTSFPSLQCRGAPASTPALLGISRETRALARSHYELAFSWKVPHVLLANDTISSSSWSRPRVWFNYALDAVYLLGELEPCDSYGFNSPMAYFLSREDALRVRRLAVAFAALRYGEAGSQDIFGALFHVIDRFKRVEGGKVLVAVTPRDELTHVLMGGEKPLVRREEDEEGRGGRSVDERGIHGRDASVMGGERSEEGNVVQNIWRDWYRGSIVLSSLANVQFELVRESDLAIHVAKPFAKPTANGAS
ncbi:hypothetical protein M426DRAFT_139996 [Hypoxylon sp. CI-4A]|nr:hypothetical protein M426DRAFT_139996 [Hypoxylon sp. CI-4A]